MPVTVGETTVDGDTVTMPTSKWHALQYRVGELEEVLGELLDAFNPAPRVSTHLTIWGRAAMVLDGTSDQDASS